jgi:hypothetical protein
MAVSTLVSVRLLDCQLLHYSTGTVPGPSILIISHPAHLLLALVSSVVDPDPPGSEIIFLSEPGPGNNIATTPDPNLL